MQKSGFIVVQSECRECNIRVHWRMHVDPQTGNLESSPIDVESSFVCDHSTDVHQSSTRALINKSGRGSSGPAFSRVLSDRTGFAWPNS